MGEETTTKYKANQYFIAERDSIQLKNCMSCQEPFDFKDNPVWIKTSDDPLNKCTIYICKKMQKRLYLLFVKENRYDKL